MIARLGARSQSASTSRKREPAMLAPSNSGPAPSACSAFQFTFDLSEEAPVRAVGNDLVGGGFDHAALVQPQRVESDRVFRVVFAPFVVAKLRQRLQRIIIT